MHYKGNRIKRGFSLFLTGLFIFSIVFGNFSALGIERTAKAADIPSADELIAKGPWVEGETATVSGSVYKKVWSEDFEDASKTGSSWKNGSVVRSTEANSTEGGQYSARFDTSRNYLYHGFDNGEGQYLVIVKMYDPDPNAGIQSIFTLGDGDGNGAVGIANSFIKDADRTKYLYRFAWENNNTYGFSYTPVSRTQGWHTWMFDYLRESEARIWFDGMLVGTNSQGRKVKSIEFGNKWDGTTGVVPMYWDDIEVYEAVPTALNVGFTTTGITLKASYNYYHLDSKKTEGTPIYRWLKSDRAEGEFTYIDGATDSTYVMSPEDDGKFFKVEVIPRDINNMEGQPVQSMAVQVEYVLPLVPSVTDIRISGDNVVNGELTVNYTYMASISGAAEGNSIIKWYVSDTQNGTYTVINGAGGKIFVPTAQHKNKYIKAEVTPVDVNGAEGVPVQSGPVKVYGDCLADVNAATLNTIDSVLNEYKEFLGIESYYDNMADIDKASIVAAMVGQYSSLDEIRNKFIELCYSTFMPDQSIWKIELIEDFENGLGKWTSEQGKTFPTETTDKKHTGNTSVFVGAGSDNALRYNFSKGGKYRVTAYIYDDVSVKKPICVVKFDGNVQQPLFGLYGAESVGEKYWVYRKAYGQSYLSTGVERKTGWHKLVMEYVSGHNVHMYIDGKLVYDSSTDPEYAGQYTSATALVVGHLTGTGEGAGVYMDSICVASIAVPPAISNLSIVKSITDKNEVMLTADYTYDDPAGFEDNSKITWYKADSENGPYKAMEGENSKTLKVSTDDTNKYFKVSVTAFSLDERTGNTLESSPVQEDHYKNVIPVASKVSIDTTKPVKVGLPVEGQYTVIKGAQGNEVDESKFAYKWYVSDTESGPYEEIPGANGKTFTPSIEYAGAYLKFAVKPADINGLTGLWAISETAVQEQSDIVDVVNELIENEQKELIIGILPRYFKSLGVEDEMKDLPENKWGLVYTAVLAERRASKSEIIDVILEVIGEYNKEEEPKGKKKSTGSGGGGSSGSSYTVQITGAQAAVMQTPITPPVSFTDLGDAKWAEEAILAVAKEGIMVGRDKGVFAPNEAITREEFITILVRAYKLTDDTAIAHFSDVAEGQWYYKYIATAQKLGLTQGMGDGTFGVGKNISRQEMVTLLYRFAVYMGITLKQDMEFTTFTDSDAIAEYARPAVEAMVKAGIIKGMNGAFAPEQNATRAMAAQVLYNLLQQNGR